MASRSCDPGLVWRKVHLRRLVVLGRWASIAAAAGNLFCDCGVFDLKRLRSTITRKGTSYGR